MKFSVAVLLALVAFAYSETVQQVGAPPNTAFGYLKNIGVPLAEQLRQAEKEFLSKQSRIVGGVPAVDGQFPWQAGLLIDLVGFEGTAVCGASLISNSRLVTAGHCWFDGQNQAWKYTVVLGTTLLFSGGSRIETSAVFTHPLWFPSLLLNDIAVIYLPNPVPTTNTIAPIALPSGSQLNEDFAGNLAVASGFGITNDGDSLTTGQFLNHVSLNVLTNSACGIAFPLILQSGHLCTSGVGGVGTCSGDHGSPLVVNRDGQPILIGISSFGSAFGCQANLPSVFTRVTSQMNFINQHL